ncbi:hypothetical protein MAIT1_05089 [Magnetofaba australis IT-1]|uniref:Uncharacterized protein n=1 Tax=Magnetofaba australis IT-1 TaxID=1434232 RepID=A0A1Y2K9C6_9PROT|nr:hypothetical protein MAIT1_05434 [Magnetofaba australis IT-1]OSM01845.1 hypothetical protein MAIT1_05346 [Magnetofaba australis IT-1]OSM03985.1 hypothetical protein MAIT1_05243 [Magnetofaba australis IT-1]OSM07086.1 hypothetical protein MAIT1_05089 [Magnetofaba australis IT-1]
MSVERIKRFKAGSRDHEVASGVADQPLDLAFVVTSRRAAKAAIEQVMGLQPDHLFGQISATIPVNFDHGDAGVVVQNALGNAAEVITGGVMPRTKRFRGFRGEAHNEAVVAVGQTHTEKVDLALHAADHAVRLPKVHLGVSGRMAEGNKLLFQMQTLAAHILLDRAIFPVVAVFIAQPFIYPLRGVALLLDLLQIVLENLIYEPGERPQFGQSDRLAPLVAWRLRVLHHFAHRARIQLKGLRRLALAHPASGYRQTHFSVHAH